MTSTHKIHPAIATLIVIVLIGIVTSLVFVVNSQKGTESDETTQQETVPAPDSSNEPATPTDTSNYKDGTYSATASYATPGGGETMRVTVTIKDGVITDSQVTASGNSSDAQEHQEEFANGYKTLVVGKSVDEVRLSRVSGSSLTSNGFNKALDTIKEDAKV